MILDTAATACDMTGAVAAFIPGNMTKKVFGIATSASCFCRTLRNKCKKTNAFGCNVNYNRKRLFRTSSERFSTYRYLVILYYFFFYLPKLDLFSF